MMNWIKSFFKKNPLWIEGTCSTVNKNKPDKARKHRIKGNVQFILWPKGKFVEGYCVCPETGLDFPNGYTYTKDYWHDYNEYWWPNFIPNK
jgi:hypothetical protein